MIKSFSFKNYKAFKEGKIELKPITILLGVNNAGKSSILQFLLMIKQTINIDKKYKSALKLNGKCVSLGENENIFHNKKTDIPLEITFEIDDFDISRIKRDLGSLTEERIMIFERILSSLMGGKESLYTNYKYHREEIRLDCSKIFERVQLLETKINDKIKDDDKINIEELFYEVIERFHYRRGILSFYSKKENKIVSKAEHYKKAYNLLEQLSISLGDTVSLSYQIILRNNELNINKIELRSNENIILGYSHEKKHNLYSEVLEKTFFDGYINKFGSSIYFKKLNIFSKVQGEGNLFDYDVGFFHKARRVEEVEENIFIKTIFRIFKSATERIQDNFLDEDINYVGPLRASPKRYYFLDEANVSSSLNTIDGNQLTEILKENKDIKNLVNNWLKKFRLKVDVKKLADIIHNIKINQHGLNLDITDVGFGFSQVLPVIVQGFLSQDDSLTIIEQPETHLHPKMQADLADLFIDIVNTEESDDEEKKLLIETHSEYLLKRLRRRIAEKKISVNDIAIYFVHPRDGKTKTGKIEKIEINETGNFEWPKDFYEDSINDTLEFLKYQK